MLASMVYYLDDLRKRVIQVTPDQITFGLRRYKLGKLISIGVEYKSQQLMPKKIVFRFRDGKILKLSVSRLRNEEFESLLRFIETRLPQVQIDPVMLTLMRCHRAAGKAITDTGSSVEIRYQSRFVLQELGEVFTNSCDEWSKFGPILVSILAVPVWSCWIAQLFLIPVVFLQIHKSAPDLELPALLNSIYAKLMGAIQSMFQNSGHCVSDVAGHPVTVVFLILLTLSMLYGLVRMLAQPNRILVQADAIRLLLRVGAYSMCMKSIPISSINNICLHKPSEMADPSSWSMRIKLANNKHVDLRLAALTSIEKTRLTKSVQRLAPHIPIDAELLETLIPRQERSYTELWLQSLSSAPERKSLDPLHPGQMLAENYQVIRCLGVGGQGTAYLCKDTGLVESHLNELVVLKESIFPIYADSTVRMQALERFEKEASLLRRLEHPGIVALRDFFLEDHRGYLVMEHVEGNTLKQIVEDSGALSEMKVRELATQMCDILEYLHSNGIVHRDFTPDNLIMSPAGQLKLIDFNVAQQVEMGSTGTIVGKQSYLPPEQFRGKASAQSDIYAMGATLQFLLTGNDPDPISQSSPIESGAACSQSLDTIIRECTALQLQKRIQNIAELRQKLLSRSTSETHNAPKGSGSEEQGTTIQLQQEKDLKMEIVDA